MEHNYDFLGIGDITIDTFIDLRGSGAAHLDIDKGKRELCLRFADKIPYDSVTDIPAVGNAPNAAVAAARLGLRSALFTNLGDDKNGTDCIAVLHEENVGTQFVDISKKHRTNHHFVLWYKDDRTILIKHEKYHRQLFDFNDPTWVYLSSMGEDSLSFHYKLEKYLNKKPNIKLAFQPGTFQIKFGKDISGLYKRSDAFFCNKEESQRILETDESDIKKLLKAMTGLGPKIVVITDGVKGAYSYDGHEMLSMRLYPDPAPPLERTGAGDAFSSTFTVALALGKSVREALMWAPINPMSVVQQIGARAGLLTRKELEDYLAKAPADYIPKDIG